MKNILIILSLATSLNAGIFDFIFDLEVNPEAREKAIQRGHTYSNVVRIRHKAYDPDALVDRSTYDVPSLPSWVYYGPSIKTNRRAPVINSATPVKDWDDYMARIKAKHETPN